MRKHNRRTNWKFARDRVLSVFGTWANPVSTGPAARSKRYFVFFGRIDGPIIKAASAEKYWERMDRYAEHQGYYRKGAALTAVHKWRMEEEARVSKWLAGFQTS